MASKKIVPKGKSKLIATLVTGKREACAFCQRDVDDEATFGKFYAIGDIQVHYFCALLSCCLIQKGKDTEGLFGFLYHDIVAEVERSKKHKCSYCNNPGASLGCWVSQCRKQFHLPCGREKNAVSLFYGNYKSFCQQHAPKQKIPDHIMVQAKLRMKKAKSALKEPVQNLSSLKELSIDQSTSANTTSPTESVCVICYSVVSGFPSPGSFWPPCCARDAWFHRDCLQQMALNAGMHYLKCPLCNDKDQFYDAVVSQGIYVPDRDAAWELEQNAFADIYERPSTCSAEECLCEMGRGHDADSGEWDIRLCLLCGAAGSHAGCSGGAGRFVCAVCRACAPADLDQLAAKIEAVIKLEQSRSRQNARRTVMPSRMSLRRTKAQTAYNAPSTSQNNTQENKAESDHDSKSDLYLARQELNLRTPRTPPKPTGMPNQMVLKTIENTMFSPTKLVEEGLSRKIGHLGDQIVNSEKVVTQVKEKLKKPGPLSVKKKIVNTTLDELLEDILKKKHIQKEWCSPKKVCDITNEAFQENTAKEEPIVTQESLSLPNNEDIDKNAGKDTEIGKGTEIEDDSSNSTFQLPSEFIAEHNSDDSLPFLDTPKRLTTVDIQKDSSLEISENNEVVNISVVKIEENSESKGVKLLIPVKTEKCAFKYNPIGKEAETLVKDKLDMDVESFKNLYLNEIDRDFQCNFNHKHKDEQNFEKPKLHTPIDFALEATKIKEEKRKKLKRKYESKDNAIKKKKSKQDKKIILQYKKSNSKNIKVVCSNDGQNTTKSIDLTVESRKTGKRTKKLKKNQKTESSKTRSVTEDVTDKIDFTLDTTNTKKLVKNKKKRKKCRENIQVKIRFRQEQVRLKISKSQTKNKMLKKKRQKDEGLEEHPKKLKQCILQYAVNSSPNKVIIKPEHEVTPKKRNYVKLEKSDALVQTSIQSFFKKLPTN